MSDSIGDIGDFEKPPRHPNDIRREIGNYQAQLMELLMNGDFPTNFAVEYPREFAHLIGVCTGVQILDLSKTEEFARALLEGFRDGVRDQREIQADAGVNNG